MFCKPSWKWTINHSAIILKVRKHNFNFFTRFCSNFAKSKLYYCKTSIVYRKRCVFFFIYCFIIYFSNWSCVTTGTWFSSLFRMTRILGGLLLTYGGATKKTIKVKAFSKIYSSWQISLFFSKTSSCEVSVTSVFSRKLELKIVKLSKLHSFQSAKLYSVLPFFKTFRRSFDKWLNWCKLQNTQSLRHKITKAEGLKRVINFNVFSLPSVK